MIRTHYSQLLSSETLSGAIHDLELAIAQAPSQLLQLSESESLLAKPGQWCAKEVLGHLIDSAANNHQRFVRGQITAHLENGTLRILGYAQNDWVRVGAYTSRPWNELVELWRVLNQQVLHVIKHAQPESLRTPCIAGDQTIGLEFVIIDYVGHLKHHLAQALERGRA